MFRSAYEELRQVTQLHSILTTRKFELDTNNIKDFLAHQIEDMASYLITGWVKMGQIDIQFVKCLQDHDKKLCEKTIAMAFKDVCEANKIDEALGVFSILINASCYVIFITGLDAVCNYAVSKKSAADCPLLIEKIIDFIRRYDTDKFPILYREEIKAREEKLLS